MRQLLENECFDAVITVSLPFTGHLVGLLTFRKFQTFGKLKPFWLADIGDPFSFQAKSPNNAFFYQKKNRRIERKILESADALTVTTEATLRKYSEQFGEKSVEKMFVVPPLITNHKSTNHQSTNHQSTNHQSTTPPITKIGYFGSLYSPTRTPDAFLDLLTRSFTLRPDLRGRIEVQFYGEVFPEFFEKLKAEPCIRLHGLCSREAVWAAMQEMDVLLNIGNTTDFQLPSKAVDYLAAGKPVFNLSYVENDPFAAFFERVNSPEVRSGIHNLQVSNGKVGDAELHRWLEWLESEKPTLGAAEIAERVAPFLVGNIARQYFRIIESNGGRPTPLG